MSSPAQLTPAPKGEPATVRVAMWSARHRWPVVGLWFLATIGLFVASLSMGGINAADANANPNERQLEASEAYDVFNAGGKLDPSEQFLVVVGGGPGAVADPAFKASVETIVEQLHGASARDRRRHDAELRPAGRPVPGAAGRRPGLAGRDARSGSWRACRVTTRRVHALLAPVRPIVDAARAANPTLRVHAIGNTFISDDINDADLERAGRHAQDHDAADVLHPAARVRRHRRVDRAAGPGHHLAAWPRSGSSGSTARSSAPSARTRRS